MSKHRERVQKGRGIDKVAHYTHKNIDLMAHKGYNRAYRVGMICFPLSLPLSICTFISI